ncbi:dsDNA binding protein [Bacillus phage DK3]|uniref:Double-strand binding protein n=3 Tax=Hemphillvirus TaxID=2842725 RepID=A0A3T0IJ03_9CAUD|nr:dsDNA binding protein [Bacillus phage DK1]YP_009910473.1 dsDNA binding protein [Bacillus phage DK2]YP_009910520.1 dsDNA binding protein [Bacillus phage DK3]AZU99734.1 double-strand binding protein [Bacillus phage DK1]AZU99781.1 double-strand binding protein [Bacillus phage DK2]AZU99828.1 double-strand binding protein [Bacillus phage DK3]
MAKFITRTIQSSQIVVGELIDNEVKAIGTLSQSGKVDQEKALKIVRKAFPTQNVLVLDIVPHEGQYRMLEEDFIANAEKVEPKEAEEVESSEEVVA